MSLLSGLWKLGGGRRKNNGQPQLWAFQLFSHLKPELEGFWILFCLYHHTQFQVSGCNEVRSEDPRGLVIFQNLMFFCNVPADIYHAFCAGFTVTISCKERMFVFTPCYPTKGYYPFSNKNTTFPNFKFWVIGLISLMKFSNRSQVRRTQIYLFTP